MKKSSWGLNVEVEAMCKNITHIILQKSWKEFTRDLIKISKDFIEGVVVEFLEVFDT